MTVSEAIYLIVDIRRQARKLDCEFIVDSDRLAQRGFSGSDIRAIWHGVARNEHVTSANSVNHS